MDSRTHREKIVDAVKIAILQTEPKDIQTISEVATAAVLSFRMDELHYAKDDKPEPRIREGKVVGLAKRTDGWRAR